MAELRASGAPRPTWFLPAAGLLVAAVVFLAFRLGRDDGAAGEDAGEVAPEAVDDGTGRLPDPSHLIGEEPHRTGVATDGGQEPGDPEPAEPDEPTPAVRTAPGADLLAGFWGARWPEIRQRLAEQVDVDELPEYDLARFEKLDLEAFYRDLLAKLLQDLETRILGQDLLTTVLVRIPGVGGGSTDPETLAENALKSKGLNPFQKELTELGLANLASLIEEVLTPAGEHVTAIEERLREVVEEDLRDASPDREPDVGELFVSPFVTVGSRDAYRSDPLTGNPYLLLSLSATDFENGYLTATYTLWLADDPELRRLCDQLRAHLLQGRDRIEHFLGAW